MRKNYLDTHNWEDIQVGDEIQFKFRGLSTDKPVQVANVDETGLVVNIDSYYHDLEKSQVKITYHNPKPKLRSITVDVPEPIPVGQYKEFGVANSSKTIRLSNNRNGNIEIHPWMLSVCISLYPEVAKRFALAILGTVCE